jgi:hypothetical protein
MAGFQVRGIAVGSIDDAELTVLLDRAQDGGGVEAFPILFSLIAEQPAVDEFALLDELQRLGAIVAATPEARLVARLRDDLMEGLAAAEEG